MAQHLRLDGSGPFVTPTVVGSLGLGISSAQLPVQIRLAVEGGSELHLPIEDTALERLYAVLDAHFSAKKEGD